MGCFQSRIAGILPHQTTLFLTCVFRSSNLFRFMFVANQVHPKNWYPIPLVFCRPWGKLPENVPCHPKLADFANCMKKKGRGLTIFVSILDGDYHECAEDAKTACKQLSTYIEYKNCEGVAEIVVAPNMSEGFRGIVQTMGLGVIQKSGDGRT
jgi:solute carrier family 12 (potassium/chloride transporter), member 4/6